MFKKILLASLLISNVTLPSSNNSSNGLLFVSLGVAYCNLPKFHNDSSLGDLFRAGGQLGVARGVTWGVKALLKGSAEDFNDKNVERAFLSLGAGLAAIFAGHCCGKKNFEQAVEDTVHDTVGSASTIGVLGVLDAGKRALESDYDAKDNKKKEAILEVVGYALVFGLGKIISDKQKKQHEDEREHRWSRNYR